MAMQKRMKRGDSRASRAEAKNSEDVTRTISILQKILDKHQAAAKKNGNNLQPDKVQHLQNVQAMIDKLQSPLFSSLVEIQSKYNQALAHPQQTAPCPKSTAVEFSRQPELLPQFCQRYGIADVAAGTAVDKLSSSLDEKRPPERGKRRSSRGETCTTGTTPTGHITSNGRILPMLRKDSPKVFALANLSKQSPTHAEEREMADLEDRVASGIVASSTESSLSSISYEGPSQSKSPHLQQDSTSNTVPNTSTASLPNTRNPSNLVVANLHTSVELDQYTTKEQRGRQFEEELEVIVVANVAAVEGTSQLEAELQNSSATLSEGKKAVMMTEVVVKSDDDDWMETNRRESSAAETNAVPSYDNVVKGELGMRGEQPVSELRVSRTQEDFGEALSSISEEFLDDNEGAEENEGTAGVGGAGMESAVVDVTGVGGADVEDERIAAHTSEQVVDELSKEEQDQLLVASDGDSDKVSSPQSHLSDRLDDPMADHGVEDDRSCEPEGKEDGMESPGRSKDDRLTGSHYSGSKDNVVHTTTITRDSTGGSKAAAGEEEVAGSEADTSKPRDLLFFMRDRKSQTELTQALQRTERGLRSVAIVVGSSKVGGAGRVGLELTGLTYTGVFINDVIPGSEAHQRGLLRKGDQILKLNDVEIDGKASFEVDLILREATSGQEVTFEVKYNPTGYSDCQRKMTGLA